MSTRNDALTSMKKHRDCVSLYIGMDESRPLLTLMRLPNNQLQLHGRTTDRVMDCASMKTLLLALAGQLTRMAEEL